MINYMSSSFKIHDENSDFTSRMPTKKSTKQTDSKKLRFIDNTPSQGLSSFKSCKTATKGSQGQISITNRRALSNLTSSQVNTRVKPPGANNGSLEIVKSSLSGKLFDDNHGNSGKNENGVIKSAKKSTSSFTTNTNASETFSCASTLQSQTTTSSTTSTSVDEFLCTRMSVDEDPCDFTLRKAAEINYFVNPVDSSVYMVHSDQMAMCAEAFGIPEQLAVNDDDDNDDDDSYDQSNYNTSEVNKDDTLMEF